ncbi:MAG TPA: alpha/beta hydrolase [Candidatus Limnocylindria bacterium]|nr:alpha/beta hydrolase [Candidatus Limnocylindria bacterium]
MGTPPTTNTRERLLAGMPVGERRLELAGIPTAVLEGGEGPPVVLLHGPGEFALTWLRVIPELVKTHRVIAPDLPGHGASLVGSGPLDADRALAWLGELVEQTCPSPPALAGHLLAGAMGARFAGTHRDRLSRLVLVDTFGLRRLRPRPLFALTLVGFLARPTDASRDRFFRQCFVDLDGLREQLDSRWEPLMAYGLEGARSPHQKVALRGLMPQFGLRAIPAADLARISIPTTLIWGRHDRQTPLGVAEAASARYGWPLHVIENAADDPAFEQPEAFLGALRAALGSSRP